MPQSFTSLHCHIVFTTKNRTPSITAELQPRLYEYLGGILRAENSPLLAVGGMLDHVHLLVSFNKQRSVSDTLRVLKANSSKWIHEAFPAMSGFTWQAGYGAFAVSCSNLEAVERYIANQAEHHRTMSFQEEFAALLQRHGIEFDERQLWE